MSQTKLLRGRVCIGKTPDGKNINKYVTAETEEELEAKKEAIRVEFITGAAIKKDVPLWEYAEEWYRVKKEPHIAPGTRKTYRTMLTKYILPTFGIRHLRAISAMQLQEFLNGFEGKSKSQITLAKTILEALFQQAFAEGILDRNPACSLVRPKQGKSRKRRALTKEEVAGVMEAIQKNEHGLFLAVLYYLGVRRGEALGLQWGDIDFDEAQVHIQRDIDYRAANFAMEGALKTENADRFIPIDPELLVMLAEAKEYDEGEDGEYIFHTEDGMPWSENTYKRNWLRLMHDAGCTTDKILSDEERVKLRRPNDPINLWEATLTPHYFRHNFVTLLYRAGVDPLKAMKIVGHSEYQTTADIYTHLDQEMLRATADDMADVFKKVNTAARKSRYEQPQKVLTARVIQFPKAGS